jgi:hypothetical protein
MSVRRGNAEKARIDLLQKELSTLREAAIATAETNESAPEGVADLSAAKAFEALNPTEQAAASLGVHPEAFRPIGFMNAAHYNSLLKANALDDTLARRIEAYKTVSTS